VLDDATLASGPTSSDAALTAKASGDTIRVTGELAFGKVATVTYAVTVNDDAHQGDHALDNVVARTGDDPICAPDSPLCTHHPVNPSAVPPLADTGSDVAGMLALLILLLGGGGAAIVITRRRRRA